MHLFGHVKSRGPKKTFPVYISNDKQISNDCEILGLRIGSRGLVRHMSASNAFFIILLSRLTRSTETTSNRMALDLRPFDWM